MGLQMNFFRNPAIKGNLEGNLIQLRELVAICIPQNERERHFGLLGSLEDDVATEEGLYLGLARSPAARGNHHAFEGGLVYHLLEMWAAWERLRPDIMDLEHLSNERVFKAILYHDIHKAYRTYLLKGSDPWQVDYGRDPTDQLMTTDIKSIWILMRAGITLDPEQMNALLLAEGGYAKIKPKWQSVLAKLAYLLDEMSGNVASRINSSTFLDVSEGYK